MSYKAFFMFHSSGQLGKMQISLLFVLAIATFGTCKKSEAKHDGYLIHKKGHKKAATYLKINKKHHRKSKSNLTRHEVKPKEQGADYDDIDSLDTWEKREQWLFDTWNDAWDLVSKLFGEENSKVYPVDSKKSNQPKPEAELDPNSQEAKWRREWDTFRDAILGTTSTNETDYTEAGMGINQWKEKVEKEEGTLEEACFFIRPKHRRRGLKWIQSTVETDKVFLTHKITADVQESLFRAMGGNKGNIDDKSCNETYRCFMTPQAMTSMTTAIPTALTSLSFTSTPPPPPNQQLGGRPPPGSQDSPVIGNPHIGSLLKTFKGKFLSLHLEKLYTKLHKHRKHWKHWKQAALNKQGGVPRDENILCNPSDR